jgi:hypothetical protein
MRTSVARATIPQRLPQSLATDMAPIRTRKRSSRLQDEIQVAETSSTPETLNRRQAGGRFSSAVTWLKSWSQPTAGTTAAPRSRRLSASRRTAPWRNSTPAGRSAPVRVMNWSTPSIATRPRAAGGDISRRQVRRIEPVMASRTLYPPPSKSSHSVRCSDSWSGAGSESPRRFSASVMVLPLCIR